MTEVSTIYTCDNKCCNIECINYTDPNIRSKKRYWKKAGVFIYDPGQERVLLVQSRGQLYGSPKGTLEIDETNVHCAIREVKEETGLDVKEEDFMRSTCIKNKAVYYYVEKPATEIHTPGNDLELGTNDATGITWIKLSCLESCIKTGKIILNQHCRILLRRFLGKHFPKTDFIKVERRKKSRKI